MSIIPWMFLFLITPSVMNVSIAFSPCLICPTATFIFDQTNRRTIPFDIHVFHFVLYADNSQQPHPPEMKPKLSDNIILRGEDVDDDNDSDTTPFFLLESGSFSTLNPNIISTEENSNSVFHGQAVFQAGENWIADVVVCHHCTTMYFGPIS